VLLILAVACSGGGQEPEHSYVPDEGFIPSKEVAIKVAVAVWGPIYGAEKIAKEKPYRATLTDGVWTVEGSLPKGSKGGVALARIAKKDGRILRVTHGK
jgi:NTF2 fold immunity protein